jgi:NAD dependent epimerase/dehydratase family enzyme
MVRLVAPRGELGRAVRRQAEVDGAAGVVINLGIQAPNTLLHDGRAWERMPPSRIVGDTRKQLAVGTGFFVHASYAFLRAVELGGTPGEHLAPIVEAALEAEALVLDGARPGCVVRVGYHYGPDSEDLRAYRLAFRIGRPFWAGPRSRRQHFVHVDDAAAALLAAAAAGPAGRRLYATDRRPVSFADFGDHFARLVGNPLPTHLPRLSRLLARAIIADEHMEAVDLGVTGAATPQVPGFQPRYGDYRAGLDAVIDEWDRASNN